MVLHNGPGMAFTMVVPIPEDSVTRQQQRLSCVFSPFDAAVRYWGERAVTLGLDTSSREFAAMVYDKMREYRFRPPTGFGLEADAEIERNYVEYVRRLINSDFGCWEADRVQTP